jgi:hypothetical protein
LGLWDLVSFGQGGLEVFGLWATTKDFDWVTDVIFGVVAMGWANERQRRKIIMDKMGTKIKKYIVLGLNGGRRWTKGPH